MLPILYTKCPLDHPQASRSHLIPEFAFLWLVQPFKKQNISRTLREQYKYLRLYNTISLAMMLERLLFKYGIIIRWIKQNPCKRTCGYEEGATCYVEYTARYAGIWLLCRSTNYANEIISVHDISVHVNSSIAVLTLCNNSIFNQNLLENAQTPARFFENNTLAYFVKALPGYMRNQDKQLREQCLFTSDYACPFLWFYIWFKLTCF